MKKILTFIMLLIISYSGYSQTLRGTKLRLNTSTDKTIIELNNTLTGADSDTVSIIQTRGMNDADEEIIYSEVTTTIEDADIPLGLYTIGVASNSTTPNQFYTFGDNLNTNNNGIVTGTGLINGRDVAADGALAASALQSITDIPGEIDLASDDNISLNATDIYLNATNDIIFQGSNNVGFLGGANDVYFNNSTDSTLNQIIRNRVSGGGIAAVVDDTTPQLGGDLDLNSNNITGTGNITHTGVLTTTGSILVDLLIINSNTVGRNTVDGSDNSFTSISGGSEGVTSRGAVLLVYGNEVGSTPGNVDIALGETTGEEFRIISNGLEQLVMNEDGLFDFQANDLTGVGDVVTETGGYSLKQDVIIVALSAPNGDLVATDSVASPVAIPYNSTLDSLWIDVGVAPTGSALEVSVLENGGNLLSTNLTIDATEFSSRTAATSYVISDADLASGNRLWFSIKQIGSTLTGEGLTITLFITRD